MVNKKHHTIGFHVDDIFSSHIESNVNDLSLNGKTQCMVIMGKYRKPAEISMNILELTFTSMMQEK